MNIEELRLLCLSMPAAAEEIKWGNDLVFTVGGKMFCIASLVPPFTPSFKVPDEAFEELCATENYIPAPYMARAKWVQVKKAGAITKKEWESFIQGSYNLVTAKLTKKVRRELNI